MVKATKPLLGERRHANGLSSLSSLAGLALVGLVGLVVLAVAIGSFGGHRASVVLYQAKNVAQTLQEASLIREENLKLQKEDAMMLKESKLMTQSLLEKKKAAALEQERNKEMALQRKNAELELENERMKQALLQSKVQKDLARLQHMRAQIVAPSATASVPTAHQKLARPVHVRAAEAHKAAKHTLGEQIAQLMSSATKAEAHATRLGKQSERMEELRKAQGEMVTQGHQLAGSVAKLHSAVKTTRLTGEYVAVCEPGKGCSKSYRPENDTSYEEENHTIIVTSNGIGYPLGPTERTTYTAYSHSNHDIIPKENKLGGHWITFGAKDSFVPIAETSFNPETLLPPWKLEMMAKNSSDTNNSTDDEDGIEGLEKINSTAVHLHCPGDPTGGDCLSGSDGVDGVHDMTLFSGRKDVQTKRLERRGIVVDNWGILGNADEKHKWDRAAVDHPPKEREDIEWDKLKHPQWAYDNAAMRSQGWNPEGEKNRQLMLGTGWNETKSVFEDAFVDEGQYKDQVQASQTYHPRDDHFADWEPESDKNQRLVYGEGAIARNKVWSVKLRKWVPTPWSVGDENVPASEAAKRLNAVGTRSGEPFRDAILGGWSGANMVAANDNYLRAKGVKPVDAPEETNKLKLQGVNTDSWFGRG